VGLTHRGTDWRRVEPCSCGTAAFGGGSWGLPLLAKNQGPRAKSLFSIFQRSFAFHTLERCQSLANFVTRFNCE
jgi:hypothetical protein